MKAEFVDDICILFHGVSRDILVLRMSNRGKPKLNGLRGGDKLSKKERKECQIPEHLLSNPFRDWTNIKNLIQSIPSDILTANSAKAYYERLCHGLQTIARNKNVMLSRYARGLYDYYGSSSIKDNFLDAYERARDEHEEVVKRAKVERLKRKFVLQGEENSVAAAIVGGKKLRRQLTGIYPPSIRSMV